MRKDTTTTETSTLLRDNDAIIENAAVDVFESVITDQDDPDDNEDIRWLREERLHHQNKLWYEKPTVFLLSLALLLYFTSMGIQISAKIMLLMKQICRKVAEDHPDLSEEYINNNCRGPLVQGELSFLTSIVTFFTGAFSCLMSGKMGELSDRFGRKPILAIVALTTLLGRCFTAYLLMDGRTYHRGLFILSSVVEEMTGGNTVVVSVSSSYITDIVEPHERIVSLGFMIGTLYGGLAIGPLLGNIVIKYIGHGNDIYALYAGLVLCALFALILVFVIKESRPMKLRRKSQSTHLRRKASFTSSIHSSQSTSMYNQFQLWRIVDIFSPLKKLWIAKHPEQGFKPRINVLIMIFSDCVLSLASAAYTSTLVLYTTYYFNWGTDNIGYYVSMVGFSKSFCLYAVSPVLLHFLKKFLTIKKKSIDSVDLAVIFIGLIFDSLGPLTVIFATQSSQVYLSAIFASLGALAGPTIQSSIVKYVSETQTGEVFGAIALIKNFILCLGPPIFLQIYSKSVATFPTLVFWITVFMFIISIALSTFLRSHKESEDGSIVTTIVDADEEEAAMLINQSDNGLFKAPSVGNSSRK